MLQIASFGLINQIRAQPGIIPFVYIVPLVVLLGSALVLSGRFKPRAPAAVSRFFDTMAQRVVRATVN